MFIPNLSQKEVKYNFSDFSCLGHQDIKNIAHDVLQELFKVLEQDGMGWIATLRLPDYQTPAMLKDNTISACVGIPTQYISPWSAV